MTVEMTARAGTRRAVHAEWTKVRSVPSSGWAALAVIVLTVLVTVLADANSTTTATQAGQGDDDIVSMSLVGVVVGQIAVITFAVLVMTSEYAAQLIRTTFTANPRRGETLFAKAVVVSLTVVVAGAVATLSSFFVGQSLLQGNGYVPPAYPTATLTDGPALRAVAGTVLLLTGLALLGLGVATILRHTAAALSVALGLVFVPLIIAPALPKAVQDLVLQTTPVAGFAIQTTVDRPDNFPIGPWAGLGVTYSWAVLALLLGYVLLNERDA